MEKLGGQLVVVERRLGRSRSPVFRIAEDLSLYRPATFVQRWYALTLDLAFFGPLNLLIGMPCTRYLEKLEAYGHHWKLLLLAVFLHLLPVVIYFVIPTMLSGRTLGKSIVGIRVVTAGYKSDLPLRMVVIREIVGKLFCLVSLGLGFLTMLGNRRRRGMHDRLSGTCVISDR